MMLQIGNKVGFTLVEVMVSVCILVLASTLLYQTILVLTEAYQKYELILNSFSWLNERIYQVKNFVKNFGSTFVQTQGQVSLQKRDFFYELDLELIKDTKKYRLYQIQLKLVAPKRKKDFQLIQAYALYNKRE